MAVNTRESARSTPTVLIVDDDAINLVVLEQLLKRAGFGVVTATNGHDALATLRNESIQLVMADINMPDMDGVELSRRIRSEMTDQKATLPILAITAYNDAAEDERFREAGMTDVLHKPVPFDTLRSVVTRLTDSED